MRVFTTHLWKEWREHRAVLLGILVAMPVLTAATFLGFASFGSQLANGAALFTGGAAAMTALALSVELFAGEVTRRTLGFWRRQPGGMALGWAAKVAMLVLAVAVATAWGGACFWTACRTFVNATAASNAWASLASADAYLVPFLVLALASWVLLTSTWVARGAAAVGIALLLLAAIAFPGSILWWDRTAFLKSLLPGIAVAAPTALLFPLALSSLSVFVGRRRADRPLRAALVCFGVLAVGSGAAYAHVHARLERWDDVRIDDPDARVSLVQIGEGGHFAFVTMTRAGDEAVRRPFAIDLRTGAGRPIGPPGTYVFPWGDESRLDARVGRGGGLFQRYSGFEIDATRAKMELFDGATGTSLGERILEPFEGRELEEQLEIQRTRRRASTPVRTLDGRKAWSIRRLVRTPGGSSWDKSVTWTSRTWIERETVDGAIDRVEFPPLRSPSASYATPFGWVGWFEAKSVFIPADVRTTADFVPFELPGKGSGSHRIDARRNLWRSQRRDYSWSWRVVDVVTGTDVAAPGFEGHDQLLGIQDGHALVWRAPSPDESAPAVEREGGLVRIDLATGVRGSEAKRTIDAPPPISIRYVGRTPAGRYVFCASCAVERGFLVYDDATNELTRWTPTTAAKSPANVAAIVDEDTLIVTENELRGEGWSETVVRIRLGTSERTRIFPR